MKNTTDDTARAARRAKRQAKIRKRALQSLTLALAFDELLASFRQEVPCV